MNIIIYEILTVEVWLWRQHQVKSSLTKRKGGNIVQHSTPGIEIPNLEKSNKRRPFK
jgi:hypothetical protein